MNEYEYFDHEDVDSIGALVAANAVPPSESARAAAESPEEPPGRQIRIFDTTLRDGEQSPGASMTLDEKLQVAEQLVRLGVDVIEAGFPAALPCDLAAVREIARRTDGPGGGGARPCQSRRHRRLL